jgi:hypothetical protein
MIQCRQPRAEKRAIALSLTASARPHLVFGSAHDSSSFHLAPRRPGTSSTGWLHRRAVAALRGHYGFDQPLYEWHGAGYVIKEGSGDGRIPDALSSGGSLTGNSSEISLISDRRALCLAAIYLWESYTDGAGLACDVTVSIFTVAF